MLLDIIALVILCSALGKKLRNKGRKPLGYQIAMVIMWFGAELTAGLVYGVILAIYSPGVEPEIPIWMFVAALGTAALSAAAMFGFVHILPAVHAPVAKAHNFGTTGNGPVEPMSDNPYQSLHSR